MVGLVDTELDLIYRSLLNLTWFQTHLTDTSRHHSHLKYIIVLTPVCSSLFNYSFLSAYNHSYEICHYTHFYTQRSAYHSQSHQYIFCESSHHHPRTAINLQTAIQHVFLPGAEGPATFAQG